MAKPRDAPVDSPGGLLLTSRVLGRQRVSVQHGRGDYAAEDNRPVYCVQHATRRSLQLLRSLCCFHFLLLPCFQYLGLRLQPVVCFHR